MLNKFSLTTVVLLCIFLGLLLTIYSYLNNDEQMIKKQESTLNPGQIVKLYMNRFIHYFILIIMIIYPFLVKYTLTYDIFYIVFGLFGIIHRCILSECALSIMEKRILDPYYKIGSNISYEPYQQLVGFYYREYTIYFSSILFIFVSFRVLRRFINI
jgi:hypothetical protein